MLGDVSWNFTIDNDDISFLHNGQTLTIVYAVTIVDDAGATDVRNITINIDGTGGLNVHAATGTLVDGELSDTGVNTVPGNVIVDAGDSSDTGDTLTVTDVNGSAANVGNVVAGMYGDLTLFADGSYQYVANAAVDPLQVGDHVTDQFTFTVADTHGESQTTTLKFDVYGADDRATIVSADAFASLTEDAGPTIAVNGGFETGDLTGWFAAGPVSVDPLFIGGAFGNYSAKLSSSGSVEQDVATTAGQHYTLSFYVAGDAESTDSSFVAYWDGAQILNLANVAPGFTHYTFDVTGDLLDATTQFFVDYSTDGIGLYLDSLDVSPVPGPATESATGSISFSDVETADTHTASFNPQSTGYVGVFSLDPVTESSGNGSVAWHFSVDNADVQFLSEGQSLTQVYTVSIMDDHGATALQDITVTINGANDAPVGVDDTIITDLGSSAATLIPGWALALNDTDVDTADTLSLGAVGAATGGGASQSGHDAIYVEDATAGGSFEYQPTDGRALGSTATVTVTNVGPVATLTGTSGADILIGTQSGVALDGAGGNDILFGGAGAHTLTGGSGNDIFAFQAPSDGVATITDFNNSSETDRIAVSASGFGSDLYAGMDASAVFESSGDAAFESVFSRFHYDTSTQTLYYSGDGTDASAVALAHLQLGAMLHGQDLLIT